MMLTAETGILGVVDGDIPEAMRLERRWVCWKATPKLKRDGTTYLDKVPRNPRATRHKAATTRPETWGTFAEAMGAYSKGHVDGVGYCLAQGWLGIDLDGVRDPESGTLAPAAAAIVVALDTYTEVSPSGTGVKLFLRGEVPAGHKGEADGLDVEIYGCANLAGTGRYFTVTGRKLPDAPSCVAVSEGAREKEVMRLWAQLHAADLKRAEAKRRKPATPPAVPAVGALGLEDSEVVEVGRSVCGGFSALWDGSVDAYGQDDSRADAALASHLAFLCGPGEEERVRRLMESSGLRRDKWSVHATYLSRTIELAYTGQHNYYDWHRHRKKQADKERKAEEKAARVAAVVAGASSDLGGPIDLAKPHTHDEVSCARRLAKEHRGTLRYVAEWRKWLAWDGRRWRIDDGGAALHAGKSLRDALWRELGTLPREMAKDALPFVSDVGQARRLQAIVTLAATEPEMRVDVSALDNKPFLLNLRNGTLDLNTCTLRPASPADFITQLASVDYTEAAASHAWVKFITEATGGDRELAAFLQRSAGVALTGSVRDETLWCRYGRGANGKSTFLDALMKMLGEYAAPAPASFLAMRNSESHPTELAMLHGKRLVAAIEMESGARMRESLVKTLTGGDTIQARRMREDFWSLRPTWKVHVSFNDPPRVNGTDDGIRRRLRIVPWRESFTGPRCDPTLKERLCGEEERAGILMWCVVGLRAWQLEGVGAPACVMASTEEFTAQQDTLGQFLEEECETGPDFLAEFGIFSASFRRWLEERGESVHAWTANRLSSELQRRGFSKLGRNVGRGELRGKSLYRGVGLRARRIEEQEQW